MWKSLPTACLNWLSQAIDVCESEPSYPDLEVGLFYWAEQLLPLLKTLYGVSQDSTHQAALAMAEYCEVCLELCDSMSRAQELDFDPIPLWREQLREAGSAFLRAEQELGEISWEAALIA